MVTDVKYSHCADNLADSVHQDETRDICFPEQIGTDCHRDDPTAIRIRTMFVLFNRDDQLSLDVVIGTVYQSFGIDPWYTIERPSY